MKFLLPLAFLALNFATFTPGTAQARDYGSPSRKEILSDYCTEERFQSYITLAASMRDYVTPGEYSRLYIPLKVRASKALVSLRNYGPLSATTHRKLQEIVNFVDTHEKDFDALWEVEVFFDVAQDLMDMTQSLSRDLQ